MGEADGFRQVVYFLVLYDMDAAGILFTKTGWDTVEVSDNRCRSDACFIQRLDGSVTSDDDGGFDAEDEAVKLFAENGRLLRLRNYKVLSFVLIPFFFQMYNPAAASMA